MKRKLKRRMILVNYSLAILAALFCVLLFSLQAAWFIPLFLLFSPWKDERKNIFSILGGINYNGSIYSLIPLFQWAQESAYGFIGLSFYQKAKHSANIVAGVSAYQKAKLPALTFGLSFCQIGKEVFVFLGVSLYQKAKDFSSVFFGVTLYQKSGLESLLFIGASLIQLSKEDSHVGFGLSLIQKAFHPSMIIGASLFQIGVSSEILLGVTFLQKSKNLSFFGCGVAILQISKLQSEIGWGINLIQQSDKTGNAGISFGLSVLQIAGQIATGTSLSLLRRGKIKKGRKVFKEIMNDAMELGELYGYYW